MQVGRDHAVRDQMPAVGKSERENQMDESPSKIPVQITTFCSIPETRTRRLPSPRNETYASSMSSNPQIMSRFPE
jgi:hypothetical protein